MNNYNAFNANMLCTITKGLIATIRECKGKSFEEQNRYIGRINQLKNQLNEWTKKTFDNNTLPEGFEENDNNKAPVFWVPDGEGDYVVPKWVHFMDDSCVEAYVFGAPKDSLPYIINLYAKPHLDNKVPFMPMPHWYCVVLNADKAWF